MGSDRVGGRLNYDQVGVRACRFEKDASGLQERISKARRKLNAISGQSIRHKGVTISTCCKVFWLVLALIALFSCEVLLLPDKSISILEDLQKEKSKILFYGPESICLLYPRLDMH